MHADGEVLPLRCQVRLATLRMSDRFQSATILSMWPGVIQQASQFCLILLLPPFRVKTFVERLGTILNEPSRKNADDGRASFC